MDNERHTLGTHLILALVAFSWGTNNIIMKIGFNHVSAGQFGGIRMLFAFPLMIYLAFFLPGRIRFSKKDFVGIMAVGIAGLGVFQTLFPIGIDETSTPLGGILMATMPIQVVIISLLFRLEKPTWKAIAGILLTIVGLAIITIAAGESSSHEDTTIRGILFVVLAELGYGINTTFLRPYMRRYPPLQVTGLAMATSVIMYELVYLSEMRALDFTTLPPVAWLTTIYSGLIAFLLANVMWNLSVKRIGSTQVAVYGNLPPVVVLILSALIFQDLLNIVQMLGSLIILTGVILAQTRSTKPSITPTVQNTVG
ncbi:DMT family transporter [Pleomorphochaeta sp. DL1XJH-081]|uniref:DMT family transporter n=1 Tax=Pleomorphochaeta sp. DL1XJH-081 TaxID=3409690 RepID=UPI003BB6EE2C